MWTEELPQTSIHLESGVLKADLGCSKPPPDPIPEQTMKPGGAFISFGNKLEIGSTAHCYTPQEAWGLRQ